MGQKTTPEDERVRRRNIDFCGVLSCLYFSENGGKSTKACWASSVCCSFNRSWTVGRVLLQVAGEFRRRWTEEAEENVRLGCDCGELRAVFKMDVPDSGHNCGCKARWTILMDSSGPVLLHMVHHRR